MTFPRVLVALVLLVAVYFAGRQAQKVFAERQAYQRSADSLNRALFQLQGVELQRRRVDSARSDSLARLAIQNRRQQAQLALQDTMNQILARSYADAKHAVLGDSSASPVAVAALSKADSLIHGLEVLRDSLKALVTTQSVQISTLGRQVGDLRVSAEDLQKALTRTEGLWHESERLRVCKILWFGCPSRELVGIVAGVGGILLGRIL